MDERPVHAADATGADLDLLAQSYVLGELDTATEAAFEVRLATDQPAREAVAFAMDLADAAPTPMLVVRPGRRSARRTLPWIVAAAGAAAAAWILWVRADTEPAAENGTETRLAKDVDLDREELLLASWLDFGIDEDASDPKDGDTGEDALADDASLDTPDWLLNAVTTDPAEGAERR